MPTFIRRIRIDDAAADQVDGRRNRNKDFVRDLVTSALGIAPGWVVRGYELDSGNVSPANEPRNNKGRPAKRLLKLDVVPKPQDSSFALRKFLYGWL